MNGEDFFAMFEGFIRNILRQEIQAALHPSTEWRDQRDDKVLSPRLHCAAARRRIAEGKTDAKKVGKNRYLLTTDAIADELDRLGRPKALTRKDTAREKPLTPEEEALASLERRLQRGM